MTLIWKRKSKLGWKQIETFIFYAVLENVKRNKKKLRTKNNGRWIRPDTIVFVYAVPDERNTADGITPISFRMESKKAHRVYAGTSAETSALSQPRPSKSHGEIYGDRREKDFLFPAPFVLFWGIVWSFKKIKK